MRRTRGPTRAQDVWQLPEGERIVVTCNQLGQPIKQAGNILSTFLGSVARKGQLCPINYTKWNEMLESYKVDILRIVQVKYFKEFLLFVSICWWYLILFNTFNFLLPFVG